MQENYGKYEIKSKAKPTYFMRTPCLEHLKAMLN